MKPFAENVSRVLIRQIFVGVKHMHSLGLVHFDLKLENFLVEGVLNLENVYAWIKVIDFGWSESLEKS